MGTFVDFKEGGDSPQKPVENLLSDVTQADIDAAKKTLYGETGGQKKIKKRGEFIEIPQTTTAQPEKREGTILEHVKSGLAQYPAGIADMVVQGASKIVEGLPLPLKEGQTLAAKVSPFTKKMTNAIKDMMGVKDVRSAQTFGEKTAEFMGGAIPDILAGGAKTLPKLMEAGLTKPEAAALLGQAAKELTKRTAIAGAGATGAATAESMSDSPYASLVGSLLGGTAASFAGPRIALAKEAAKNVKQGTVAETTKALVKPIVEKNIMRQMATEATANPGTIPGIQNALKLEKEIPGLKLGAAGLTEGAAKTTLALAHKDAKAYAELLTNNNRSGQAILDYVNQPLARPQSSLDKEFAKAKAAQEAKFLAEEQKVAATRASIKEKVAKPDVAGAETRKVGLSEQERLRPTKEAQYANAKNVALVEGAQYDSTPAFASIKALEELPAFKHDFANMPQVVHALKGMIKMEKEAGGPKIVDVHGQPIDFEKVPAQLTYEQLDTALRAAKSDQFNLKHSLDANKAIKMKALGDTVDTLSNMMFNGKFKQTEIARRAADDWYKANWAPRFKEGLNAQMFMKRATLGIQKVPDSKVFTSYAANPENAKQFNTLFGHDASTVKRMEDHVTADFVKKVTESADPAKSFTNWFDKNRRTLDILGESNRSLPNKFSSFEAALQNTGLENIAAMKDRDLFNKAGLGKLLKTNDVDQIVTKAYNDRQTFRNISQHLDADGKKVLFNNIMDEFHSRVKMQDPGTVAMDATKMKAELTKNYVQLEEAAKNALGEKEGKAHMQRLQKAADAFAILEKTHVPSAPGMKGPESLQDKTGVSAATAIALYRAHSTGRIGLEHAGMIVGGQALKHQVVEMSHQIYKDMMTDPDLLKKLQPLIEATKNGQKIPTESWIKQLGKFGFMWAGGKYFAPNLEILAMPAIQAQQRQQRDQDESLNY